MTNKNSCDIMDKSVGGIAQLGERLNGIQEVSGSIPLISTTNKWLETAVSSHFCICRANWGRTFYGSTTEYNTLTIFPHSYWNTRGRMKMRDPVKNEKIIGGMIAADFNVTVCCTTQYTCPRWHSRRSQLTWLASALRSRPSCPERRSDKHFQCD